MGHLSNPISIRLNYFKKWNDVFFVKNLYYPEYINNILNIRDYLLFYIGTKEMLENGFCVSHLFLIKMNKLYFIKIFVYQIDLEKSSYEYINELFNSYYKILKQTSFINFKNKKKEVNIHYKKYISYLHNADLFIYYYLFFILFAKNENEKSFSLLNKSIYFNNNKIYKFSNVMYLKFLNILIFRLKNICLKNRKELQLYKYENKNKLKKVFSILYKYENKEKLLKEEEAVLDAFQKEDFNKRRLKALKVFLFNKKREYKKFLDNLYLKKVNIIDLIFFKKKKIEFSDLFFFLAKKVSFKKYKSMFLLDVKWSKLYFYLKILHNNKFIINRFINIRLFYYYISIFINISKYYNKNFIDLFNKNRNRNRFGNFRDLLYFIIYFFLGYNAFFQFFDDMSLFFKCFFNIFLQQIDSNQIVFLYFFLSNKNVTTQLVGRYLGVRLQKNFALLKTLNPLRRELKFLYKESIKNQSLFKFYNFKFLYIKRKKKLKKTIKIYLKIYLKLFKYYYYINYKKFYNLFYCDIIKYHKLKINKFLIFKKIFYINIFYKKLLDYFLVFKDLFKSKNIIINFLFYSIFFILKICISFFYKRNNLLNNKNIVISSFFYKNLFNYKYLTYIWLLYKKLNFRLIRDRYKPMFKSVLMGYKMAFRGRFSRKQRASFIWVHNGKVSLNTISNKIDYSFFIVPLKNSVISIKIWFYCNTKFWNFKYVLRI